MVAILIYSLAAVGVLALVGCAAILYGCVRIAREFDSNESRSLQADVDDSHDPRNAEYAGPRLYKSEVRR